MSEGLDCSAAEDLCSVVHHSANVCTYTIVYTMVYTYTYSVHHGGTSITSVGGTPNQYSSNIQIVQNNVSDFCSVWYTGNIQIVPGVIRSKMSELDGIQKDSPACKTWRFNSRLQICQMSACNHCKYLGI